MKLSKILALGFFLIFLSCSSTKTTKVYIEVGVNDYTKSKNQTAGNTTTKTKGLDTGIHQQHFSDSNHTHHTTKKHH